MDEDFQRDQDLHDRQGGRTFRLGTALRRSFEPRDEQLNPSITRLMLELSHVPDRSASGAWTTERDAPAARPTSGARRLFGRIAARLF